MCEVLTHIKETDPAVYAMLTHQFNMGHWDKVKEFLEAYDKGEIK
jgi:hypothetical protein